MAEESVKVDGRENFPARTLTHEELDAVQGSDDFLDFIERSSKVIERALEEEYDVLADYAVKGISQSNEDDDEPGVTKGRRGRRIKEVYQFQDEKWTKRRMISDLDFSAKVGLYRSMMSSYANSGSFPSFSWRLTQKLLAPHSPHQVLH